MPGRAERAEMFPLSVQVARGSPGYILSSGGQSSVEYGWGRMLMQPSTAKQFVIDQLGGYGESVPALTDDGLGAYDAVVNCALITSTKTHICLRSSF